MSISAATLSAAAWSSSDASAVSSAASSVASASSVSAAASVTVSSAVLSDAITPAVPIIDTVVTANSVASAFTVLFFIVSSSFGTNVPGGCSLSESVVLM